MSLYYKFKNRDTKTRVQKIKEELNSNLDNQSKDEKSKFKLPSDPGKDPSSPLRQLGVTDTFAGVRASNNFTKKKIIGESIMPNVLPIKQIILESDFLRNRPMLSASMAAGLGGLATYDYMKTNPSSVGNYLDSKINQVKNIQLPTIGHTQTLGEKISDGLSKIKHNIDSQRAYNTAHLKPRAADSMPSLKLNSSPTMGATSQMDNLSTMVD